MKDLLTEWMYGRDQAVRLITKSLIRGARPGQAILVASTGFRADEKQNLVTPENEGHWERWDGEMILLPRRKFSGTLPNGGYAHAGKRVDQILCSSWDNDGMWGPMYWSLSHPGA